MSDDWREAQKRLGFEVKEVYEPPRKVKPQEEEELKRPYTGPDNPMYIITIPAFLGGLAVVLVECFSSDPSSTMLMLGALAMAAPWYLAP